MNQPNESTWELPERVRDLMSRRVVTCGPDVDVAFAMQLMLWSGVRHLPVVDDGKLVGILSDRDFLPTDGERTMREFLATPVNEVMTRDVRTITPDGDLQAASAEMAMAHIHCFPVVNEDGGLVGILTSTDLLAERGRILFKGGKSGVPSVGDLMTGIPTTAMREDSLRDIARTMLEEGVRHLPIVDDDGAIVGIVSDRDLRTVLGDLASFLGGGDSILDVQRAEDVMTTNPVAVAPDASLFDLASCFIDDRISAVPVVDANDKLVGILSYVDVLAFILKGR